MRRVLGSVALAAMAVLVCGSYEDRYDRSKMPWDLRPVQNMIGLWSLTSKTGRIIDLPPPDQIDFAINPIPKFGARAINITHTYFHANGQVNRHDYGFMPVKNATRRDPRVHVAYLTTSSEGWSMMEQGQARGSKLTFHLKQFLSRTFGVGKMGDLDIREFERQFEQKDYNNIVMMVRAETARDSENYSAFYKRILG
ncbi:hypothetical protein PFISCL1PPCAC_1657 [Pristionchus fissidentatus]|uniref:THAP4-like heme-binding domain-containing protein n=1 Tax=Pristionchus fissidentatus TaxID=1538716 RepID=A0AAV5UW26_9BILA|nr:hypothetical protein PFISCL1PPCAC_1657 [Pristionchus fissidentatus]